MSAVIAEPHDEADLKAMWRVLAGWLRAKQAKGSVGPVLAQRLQEFTPVDAQVLEHTVSRAAPPLRLHNYGWVVGDPLPRYGRPVVPVTTVVVEKLVNGRVSELKMRVALLREREDGSVHAEGWRFESAEHVVDETDPGNAAVGPTDSVTAPPHPYAHAQAIFGWERDSPCLIHPPHSEDDPCDGIDLSGHADIDAERLRAARATLDTHPAFPLPATTLTGLALAVVATLYGARQADAIVEGDALLAHLDGFIAGDLDLLRGLTS